MHRARLILISYHPFPTRTALKPITLTYRIKHSTTPIAAKLQFPTENIKQHKSHLERSQHDKSSHPPPYHATAYTRYCSFRSARDADESQLSKETCRYGRDENVRSQLLLHLQLTKLLLAQPIPALTAHPFLRRRPCHPARAASCLAPKFGHTGSCRTITSRW
jgi:hypothetical protein